MGEAIENYQNALVGIFREVRPPIGMESCSVDSRVTGREVFQEGFSDYEKPSKPPQNTVQKHPTRAAPLVALYQCAADRRSRLLQCGRAACFGARYVLSEASMSW